MLSNRLIAPFQASPEDIFNDSLGRLFPDDVPDHHGSPGSDVIYRSPRFRNEDLEIRLSDYTGEEERRLFAHHVWNAALMLSQCIEDNEKGIFDVRGESVIELGAGSAFVSLTAARCGADKVVITDYPSPAVMAAIKANVDKNYANNKRVVSSSGTANVNVNVNFNFNRRCNIAVEPYRWGDPDAAATLGRFSIVAASDCLWNAEEHENLARSMLAVLSSWDSSSSSSSSSSNSQPAEQRQRRSRVWVVAGFHTGRSIVRDFFDTAVREGLAIERIWERNSKTAEEREWVEVREGEGVGERKVWCVIAVLRRASEGLKNV